MYPMILAVNLYFCLTWLSGAQDTQYTGLELVARVDLSIPDLDQILTAPSSPPVTIPAPSQLHLSEHRTCQPLHSEYRT